MMQPLSKLFGHFFLFVFVKANINYFLIKTINEQERNRWNNCQSSRHILRQRKTEKEIQTKTDRQAETDQLEWSAVRFDAMLVHVLGQVATYIARPHTDI